MAQKQQLLQYQRRGIELLDVSRVKGATGCLAMWTLFVLRRRCYPGIAIPGGYAKVMSKYILIEWISCGCPKEFVKLT
jgi:hypothetical protein